MNKFGFLLSVLAIASTSLLTSCFSSSGELDEPNIPSFGTWEGTMVNTSGTTYVTAVSKVVGLEGYAVVPKEAAIALVGAGWGGILIILDEVESKRLLDDPVNIASHSFEVNTIKASCYPDGVSFGESGGKKNTVGLTVKTGEAEGLDIGCELSGKDEYLTPTIDSEGVHVELPHFCDWLFKIKGTVEVVDSRIVESDSIEAKIHKGDNVIKYTTKYGYETTTKNPFAISYIKSLVGASKTKTSSFNHYRTMSGKLTFCYTQKVVTVKLTSGTRSFNFDIYGAPTLKGFTFVSDDHNGGSGTNL